MIEAEAMWRQASSLLAVARAPASERRALEALLDEARAKFPRTNAVGRRPQSAFC
jgi:hypothetical protein